MAVSCKKNQVLNFCNQPDVVHCETDYCVKYKQTDSVAFQVNLSEYNGEELVIGGDLEPIYTGTATSTSANELVDSSKSFYSTSYSLVGYTVKNITDNTYATITAMNNDYTKVSLSADIMASGESYEILSFKRSTGILTYNETNNYWERAGASTADYLIQENILKANHYYKVTFDLTSVSGGGAGVSRDDIGDVVQSYTESGTYTTYFKSTSANLYIWTSGQIQLDNISVELMSGVLVSVLDCDGEEVFYDENDEFGLVTYYEGLAGVGMAQVDILWSDLNLDDGSYRVCVKDKATLAYNLFYNGEFDRIVYSASEDPATTNKLIDSKATFQTAGIKGTVINISSVGESDIVSVDSQTQLTLEDDIFSLGCCDAYIAPLWKLTNANVSNGFSMAVGIERMIHSSGVAGTDTIEPVDLTIDPLKSYILRYQITDESALLGSYQVDGTIRYDTATTTDNQLAILAGGVNEVEINNLAITRLYIESSEQGVYGIEYLRLYEKPECVGESRCVSLNDHTDTVLLTWTNDENFKLSSTDYIDYENFTYIQKLRVKAKFGDPFFEKEKEVFRYDNGIRENIYSRSTEIMRLTTENIPPYLHRALAIGLDHDTFTVDGIEYVSEEDSYNPSYRRSSNLAPAIVELVNADQRNENSKC